MEVIRQAMRNADWQTNIYQDEPCWIGEYYVDHQRGCFFNNMTILTGHVRGQDSNIYAFSITNHQEPILAKVDWKMKNVGEMDIQM